MLRKTHNKATGTNDLLIKLNKQELIDLTNKACDILYRAKDSQEHNVLAFEEHSNGSVTVKLLSGKDADRKCDLFPRGEDPNMHIYKHLVSLYGMDDAL